LAEPCPGQCGALLKGFFLKSSKSKVETLLMRQVIKARAIGKKAVKR
jgi:hypothetical protein